MASLDKANGNSTDATGAHVEGVPVEGHRPLDGHTEDASPEMGSPDQARSPIIVANGKNRVRIWEAWTAISGAVGLLLYLFGWVFVDRFYGEFGVDPEDVGVGFAWLVSRVAITTTLLLASAFHERLV
jgi:hypothetical protein